MPFGEVLEQDDDPDVDAPGFEIGPAAPVDRDAGVGEEALGEPLLRCLEPRHERLEPLGAIQICECLGAVGEGGSAGERERPTPSLGVHAAAAAELFPTRTRQTGLSIAYSLTAAIFAGTVPYVLTWLIAQTGNDMMPAFYLILVGLIGLAAVLSMKESKGKDLLSGDDVTALPGAVATKEAPPISL